MKRKKIKIFYLIFAITMVMSLLSTTATGTSINYLIDIDGMDSSLINIIDDYCCEDEPTYENSLNSALCLWGTNCNISTSTTRIVTQAGSWYIVGSRQVCVARDVSGEIWRLCTRSCGRGVYVGTFTATETSSGNHGFFVGRCPVCNWYGDIWAK